MQSALGAKLFSALQKIASNILYYFFDFKEFELADRL